MENEEEEEEGEGGLEQNCPPNPYQMHPPPEGCCTTDGEMPARLRAEGPRGVSRARVASRPWPGGPSRPGGTGYTTWGPVTLWTAPPLQTHSDPKVNFSPSPFKSQNIPAEVGFRRVFISALMSRRNLSHLWLLYR